MNNPYQLNTLRFSKGKNSNRYLPCGNMRTDGKFGILVSPRPGFTARNLAFDTNSSAKLAARGGVVLRDEIKDMIKIINRSLSPYEFAH